MKVSIRQLEMVLYKMKYAMLGYNSDEKVDVPVEITVTQEDPGNGIMVDCLTLRASKPIVENQEKSDMTDMSVELYPIDQNLDPVAVTTNTFKITKK